MKLHHGDCLEVLKTLPDCSVDAVVTDPPYGLSFMGRKWDYDVPSEAIWRECLRVLKPGGHLLAFAGTRTQHRMAVRIEDAGFEIRDMIAWVYGSGFPKSHDVSKAIDRQRHDSEQVYQVTAWIRSARDTAGKTNRDIDDAFGFAGMAGHWTSSKSQPAVPTLDQIPKLLDVLGLSLEDVPDDIRELIWTLNGNKGQPGAAWFEREVVGKTRKGAQTESTGKYGAWGDGITPTAPATPAAKQWHGWGTALKPALEPITVARKPLVGTVANNVLQWGTGGLNIDGCRVEGVPKSVPQPSFSAEKVAGFGASNGRNGEMLQASARWPSNLIHDGSDEVVAGFPVTTSGALNSGHKQGSGMFGSVGGDTIMRNYGNAGGSAARFFYCSKASKRDRDEGCEGRNTHETVKPTNLMRYLCRLVTPPGGTVLDPFMGSGSTGKAAVLEGFDFIGIEREADYMTIAKARIDYAARKPKQTTLDI